MASEIMNFIKRNAWTMVPREKAHKEGRRIVGTKWVYRIKAEQDGSKRYKLRAVVQGYMQVPGVDITESFSPVATDSSIRIVIGISLYYEHEDQVIEMFDV